MKITTTTTWTPAARAEAVRRAVDPAIAERQHTQVRLRAAAPLRPKVTQDADVGLFDTQAEIPWDKIEADEIAAERGYEDDLLD